MYHVSKIPLESLLLVPRIPDNFFTINGYEDNVTPRVCVSETIEGALGALNQNIIDEYLYVYKVSETSVSDNRWLFNDEIIGKVPDAHLTGEMWSLDPVELEFLKIVMVVDSGDMILYDYGNPEGKAEFWPWLFEDVSYDINFTF